MDWLWIILLIVLVLLVAWWLLNGSRRRSSTMDASSRSAYDRGAAPRDSTSGAGVAGGGVAGAVDAGMPDADDVAMGDSASEMPAATDRHDFTTSEAASATTAQTGDIADSDLDAARYEVDDMAMPGDDMATSGGATGVAETADDADDMVAATGDEAMASETGDEAMASETATAGGAIRDTTWDEADVEGDYVADVVDYERETPPGGAEDVTAEPAATIDEMAAGVSGDPMDDAAAMAPSDMGEMAGGSAIADIEGTPGTDVAMGEQVAADRDAMDYAATGDAGIDTGARTYDTATGSGGDDMAAGGFAEPATASADGPYGAGSAAPAEDGSGPSGYDIKGNADSMLYHTTDSPSYGGTRAEVWFANEEAARNAGFTRWNER
ncbi:MAG: hypothetical protein H0V96_01125 [Acidimicrobiia bacterium]|nr:hypothetical protein [Acidimicrobiia bacterium]